MSLYDYLICFWQKNEYDQCSLSEIALYFCLLHESNRQHWVSPFKANTRMLMVRLGTSKQNVMKARDALVRRGLISYVKGDGKGKPALYTLLFNSSDKYQQSQVSTQALTRKMTTVMTQRVTEALPPALPLLKNKEKDTINAVRKKEPSTPFPSHHNKLLTLDELQAKLLADTEWLSELSKRLSAVAISLSDVSLKGKIIEFFEEQQSKGITEKEEVDCRNYVFNWIRYHSNKKVRYGQDSRSESKGGRTQISTNRPEDYEGTC